MLHQKSGKRSAYGRSDFGDDLLGNREQPGFVFASPFCSIENTKSAPSVTFRFPNGPSCGK